jgi:general transcription factor 3C polypeptide 3 (transcription factor C subunit 4)
MIACGITGLVALLCSALLACREKNLLAQEASFNMGRAYHQLNLLHLAVPYYEQTLRLAVAHDKAAARAARGGAAAAGASSGAIAGLEREAAYNLFLIYRSQKGSQRLAREILRQHLTV